MQELALPEIRFRYTGVLMRAMENIQILHATTTHCNATYRGFNEEIIFGHKEKMSDATTTVNCNIATELKNNLASFA